jgi:hypothetical protein
MSIRERASAFRRLHAPGQLLVLPVAWAEMNALFPAPAR